MDCKYIKADTVLPYSSALFVRLYVVPCTGVLCLHGSLTTWFSKYHGFSKLKISAMFLNSMILGEIL